MTAELVELADDAASWDAYVERFPGATLYNLYAWKKVAEDAYGLRAPFLVVRNAPHGPICGVLPLVRVPRPLAPYLTTGLFGAYGPLLADEPRHALALVTEAVRRIDEGEAKVLHLKLLGPAPPVPGIERRELWVTAQLDLGGDPGACWNRLDAPMRTKIRRAERAGLTVRIGRRWLGDFYEVLSENMLRKGAPIYGERFMARVLDALGARADVLVLLHQGRVVSGALLAWFHGVMTVPFASSRPSALRQLRPNHLLYWAIARHAVELGHRTLDFGSSMKDSTGLDFKRSWKPQIEPIGSYVYHGRHRAPPLLPAESVVARNVVKVWSHLSPRVAEMVGPRVCRWIA